MTNFEYMKEKVISQIQDMNQAEFEYLCEVLRGDSSAHNLHMNIPGFTCVDCETIFKNKKCDIQECNKRKLKFYDMEN